MQDFFDKHGNPGGMRDDFDAAHLFSGRGFASGASGAFFNNKNGGGRTGGSSAASGNNGGGPSPNHFAVLGLKPGASKEQARAAYLRLSRQYHPDSGDVPDLEKFKQVKAAHQAIAGGGNSNGGSGSGSGSADTAWARAMGAPANAMDGYEIPDRDAKGFAGSLGTDADDDVPSFASAFRGEPSVTRTPGGAFYDGFSSNNNPAGMGSSQPPTSKPVTRASAKRRERQPTMPPQTQPATLMPPPVVGRAKPVAAPPKKVDPRIAEIAEKTKKTIEGTIKLPLRTFFCGSKETFDMVRYMPCGTCQMTSNQTCYDCNGTSGACGTCHGTGFINTRPGNCKDCGNVRVRPTPHSIEFMVEKGTVPGTTVTFDGEGHMNRTMVKVTMDVEDDKTFVVSGRDMVMTRKIMLSEALRGYRSVCSMPDGKRITFQCTTPVTTGTVVTIKGKGLPATQQHAAGDILIVFTVQVSSNDSIPVADGDSPARIASDEATARALEAARSRGVEGV